MDCQNELQLSYFKIANSIFKSLSFVLQGEEDFAISHAPIYKHPREKVF